MVLATLPPEFHLLTLGFTRILILVVCEEGQWVALLGDSAWTFSDVREIKSICSRRYLDLSI